MSYNSSRFQVRQFFTSQYLKISQVQEIKDIVNVIAKYMIVDRDILNFRAGEKKGLSHIQRCIDLDLIVEMKSEEENQELSVNHFFKLGMAGISLLEQSGINFQIFNLLESFEAQNSMLQFNYYAMEKEYEFIFSPYNDLEHYNYFHCKNQNNKDIILYFLDSVSEFRIIENIKSQYIKMLSEEQQLRADKLFERYISRYAFEEIDRIETNFNKEFRADLNSINSRMIAEQRRRK